MAIVIVIVIVNSWFLERPQKRSRMNQLIHRRLTKTKSIGSGQDPESQAGRQLDGYGGWCLELRRGGRYGDLQNTFTFFREVPVTYRPTATYTEIACVPVLGSSAGFSLGQPKNLRKNSITSLSTSIFAIMLNFLRGHRKYTFTAALRDVLG